jgi:RecA/RadA recombinase
VQHLSLRPPTTNAAAGADSWRNREFRRTPREPGFGIGRPGSFERYPALFVARFGGNSQARNARASMQSGAIDVLVIDSVAALVPRAENLS